MISGTRPPPQQQAPAAATPPPWAQMSVLDLRARGGGAATAAVALTGATAQLFLRSSSSTGLS